MRSIRVSAPARLHFGFLDLHGGRGRLFGSLGLTLNKPKTTLVLHPAEQLSADGPDSERARAYAERIIAAREYRRQAHIHIEDAIPPHSGLGSGTQLALAVGTGLALLNDAPPADGAAAGILNRGARSGIGLAAFARGGLILDGGRPATGKAAAKPPPLIARLPFPEQWRFILVFDQSRRGVHGRHEKDAFNNLPPYSETLAADLCRLTLMQALPAAAEGDLTSFGRAITELQAAVGDYFSSAQNGRYASPLVSEALSWLAEQGIAGYGQSSWGPTGFALIEDESRAKTLSDNLRHQRIGDGRLSFMICRARNTGHEAAVEAAV